MSVARVKHTAKDIVDRRRLFVQMADRQRWPVKPKATTGWVAFNASGEMLLGSCRFKRDRVLSEMTRFGCYPGTYKVAPIRIINRRAR